MLCRMNGEETDGELPAEPLPAVVAECAGPMAEGCPRKGWLGADDAQHIKDIGWIIDPITGAWLCEFCQGIVFATRRLS